MGSDDNVDELADCIVNIEEDNPDNDSESEVDQLNSSDSDGGAGEGSPSMKATLLGWAKDIPLEKFQVWSAAPPEIKKKQQQKIIAREKAKVRRQEKREQKLREKNTTQRSGTRGEAGGKGAASESAGTADSNSGVTEKITGTGKGKGRAAGGSTSRVTRSESKKAKRKSEDSDTATQVHDSSDTENKPPVKRPRSDAPAPREYTAYILLQQPSPTGPGSGRTTRFSKAAPKPEPTSSEPIFFDDDETFDGFLDKLAGALSCHVDGLCLEQMAWVFEKPKNGQKRPLGTESGYQAMVKQLQARKQDSWVVNVHMPPPKQIRRTIGQSRAVIEIQSEHDYDDYVDNPMGMPIQEQMTNATRELAPLVQRLEDRYPINNMQNIFPRKRIFARGGHYWELTGLRLQAWAKAWSKGQPGVDIENPPNSMHFDPKQGIQAPSGAAALGSGSGFPPTSLAAPSFVPSLPLATSMPLLNVNSHPSFALAPTSPALAQALYALAATLTVPNAPLVTSPLAAVQPVPHLMTNNPGLVASTSSTSSVSAAFTIRDFCANYQIPEEDRAGLERLAIIPGDPKISEIPEERWRAEKFTQYTWGRVVLANQAYIGELNGSSSF